VVRSKDRYYLINFRASSDKEDESSRERRLIFSGQEATQCWNWIRRGNGHIYIDGKI